MWRPWGRAGAVGDSAGVVAEGGVVAGQGAPREAAGGGVFAEGSSALASASAPGEAKVAEVVAGAAGAGAGGDGGPRGLKKMKRLRWEPKYLTVKAVFFLFYSSLGAIMPYLPVYYHSLGIPDR